MTTITEETLATTPQCPVDVKKYPKLDRKQAGHIRHFHNLASALDGDWPHMGTQDPEQAFLDAYRYQLATMVYASALTYYHRLPMMRNLFKPLIRRLIHKMLLPHCWNYWYLTSQSGIRLDPDIKELRRPWADPIVKENIMYSGHLLLMTSLYAMLFDDDEFEKPGSLTFTWSPMMWGMGPETFEYDNGKLQSAIIAEMEREGWVGVCCEPNLIFVVCNQFPLIAMRLNDVRHGTEIGAEVLDKYWTAVQKKGMVKSNSLFADALTVKQDLVRHAHTIGFTAWGAAYMNAWNSDFVKASYLQQSHGFITTSHGNTRVQHPKVAAEFRRLAVEEGASNDPEDALTRAQENFLKSRDPHEHPFQQPLFGYVTEWLAELGKSVEVNSLLQDIDANCSPQWENGGYFYPRNDTVSDETGKLTFMDTFSGNAGIAHGRLNVPDGMKKIWDRPWTSQDVSKQPYVSGFDLSKGVDCLRGVWDEMCSAVIISLKVCEGLKSPPPSNLNFTIENLPAGKWQIYQDCDLTNEYQIGEGGCVHLNYRPSARKEVDFVVLKL